MFYLFNLSYNDLFNFISIHEVDLQSIAPSFILLR